MKDIDYHLLVHKFLSGEISVKEKEKLESWLDRRHENRELFDEIKLIWDNANFSEMELDYDPEEELRAIQERIRRAQDGTGPYPIKSKRPRALKIAVMVFLLVATNFLVWSLARPSGNGTIRIINRQYYNEVLLPHGSKAYLNKNTSLSFEGNEGKREAYLKGEAYFEVEKDEGSPFFVHLQNTTIKVVGTSFNVKAYPGKDSAEVIVASGTVNVYNDSDSARLGQGEKATFHRHKQNISKSINTDMNFDSWRTGKLQFNNTELSNILAILEDYYQVSFRVKNNRLLTCRFTGTFERDKLEKVLKILSYGLNFDYRYQEGQYILTGEGCKKNN